MKIKYFPTLCSLLFSLIYLSASPASAIGVKACFNEARNDVEKLYCDILSRGKGQSLPDFYEFRRNPINTQRLLLTAPARQLGLEVPKARRAKKALEATPTDNNTDEQGAPNQNTPAENSVNSVTSIASPQTNPRLQNCRLERERIACQHGIYYLVVNIPRERLNQAVLTESNRFEFSPRPAEHSDQQYLSLVYPYYIEKMLALGLGDSTMSYTKFVALFQEAQKNQNESFAERFSAMYELLKQERRSMAVKPRYRNNFPSDIAQCMPLKDELITCDNVAQNWVYRQITGG